MGPAQGAPSPARVLCGMRAPRSWVPELGHPQVELLGEGLGGCWTGLKVHLVPSGVKHPSKLGGRDFSTSWRRAWELVIRGWWVPAAAEEGGGSEVVQGTFSTGMFGVISPFFL